MTLIFEVNVEDDNLAGMTSAQRRKVMLAKQQQRRGKAFKGANVKRYVVSNAMTLERIAAEQLGNSNRWREIRRLNPKMRDPRRIIKAGTIISLP
jgi:nucleoid-associated protein YgaU